MKLKDKFEGVKSNVRNNKKNILTIALTAFVAMVLIGCGSSGATGGGAVDTNTVAATVNGKDIKMEQVDQLVNQKAQGQQNSFSPLELAAARLQVLDGLIQEEVLYQKAEKENALPSDEQVTAEINRLKTTSGKSAEDLQKEMQANNETEQSLREKVKRKLAVQKLEENLTGKIEPPKDSEIEAFYNGNKSAFVTKRGAQIAAIVIDPTNSGEGDKTTNDQEAALKGNELIKQLQQGAEFAKLASENSEDQSGLQGGDLGYIPEEQLKQTFSPQVAATLMDPKTPIGFNRIAAQSQGKYFILKLQDRKDKDEDLTLESPGVREKVATSLIDARKQLLRQSYAAIAMNEAKVINYLAEKIVDNPNEMSGARPAGATPNATPNANTEIGNANANAADANANTMTGNANTTNAAVKNANAKPKNAK